MNRQTGLTWYDWLAVPVEKENLDKPAVETTIYLYIDIQKSTFDIWLKIVEKIPQLLRAYIN